MKNTTKLYQVSYHIVYGSISCLQIEIIFQISITTFEKKHGQNVITNLILTDMKKAYSEKSSVTENTNIRQFDYFD